MHFESQSTLEDLLHQEALDDIRDPKHLGAHSVYILALAVLTTKYSQDMERKTEVKDKIVAVMIQAAASSSRWALLRRQHFTSNMLVPGRSPHRGHRRHLERRTDTILRTKVLLWEAAPQMPALRQVPRTPLSQSTRASIYLIPIQRVVNARLRVVLGTVQSTMFLEDGAPHLRESSASVAIQGHSRSPRSRKFLHASAGVTSRAGARPGPAGQAKARSDKFLTLLFAKDVQCHQVASDTHEPSQGGVTVPFCLCLRWPSSFVVARTIVRGTHAHVCWM